ncbi:lysophospholipid acyltransferase family protein [Streptomyces griseiscabiei]|uniref:Lysophospholipid acyltransferase family protein n=1 Tax=Streptomyces griseiscabiei TaxID=2993540 RepID=A0ABU4L3T8_9ACTN|nr:lysophospholipid acyltransferase family protein [Streptomyces griseiscabiei]MBZ3905342.1 1-acyl-sn-glycerol-3-phosphate acyltransferase [Streptomyces griseiscabiei]MDX2910429.1 lysophospholipid acyltransferase family protein [Streptomyces griseiscabiei]
MSVWLPSAPCSPQACVEAGSAAAALPRAGARFTAVVALVLLGVLVSVVGLRPPAGVVRCWCRWTVRASGVRVRITGTAPATGGLLLVANHVSWLDIPLLGAVRPARMLAKSDIRAWPVAGPLVARGGVLFIERDRIRALPETVARVADALRAGAAVVAFPEGSTWCGRAQGRFRRAVFQAALDADVPVQPVRVRYRSTGGGASTAPAYVGDDSLLSSVWRVVSATDVVAEVDVRPVIAPAAHLDRRALAGAAQTAVTDVAAMAEHLPDAGGGRRGVRPASVRGLRRREGARAETGSGTRSGVSVGRDPRSGPVACTSPAVPRGRTYSSSPGSPGRPSP